MATATKLAADARDPELDALAPDEAVLKAVQAEDISLAQSCSILFDAFAARPALGERAYRVEVTPEGEHVRAYLPAFSTISYAELGQSVTGLANAWREDPLHRVDPGEFVALLGQPGRDFSIGILAAIRAQAVHVPLQANHPIDELQMVLAKVRPVTMMVDIRDMRAVLPAVLATSTVRSLIVMSADLAIDEDRAIIADTTAALQGADRPLTLAMLDDLISYGRDRQVEPLPADPAGKDAITAILFTSGSSGTPKGAIYSAFMVSLPMLQIAAPQPTIALIFAGFNHSMGYSQLLRTLVQGGTVLFTLKSDMSTLFEDLRIARPTHLNFFPRAIEQIYQHFQGEVLRREAAGEERTQAEAAVRAAMSRTFLGDRLVFVVVGGAPLAPDIHSFFAETFGVPLTVGYGSTETAGVTFNGAIDSRFVKAFELRDVPELGYFGTDRPYPRGELAIRSTTVIPGYYQDPVATAALRDAGGWTPTGDIFEQRGPDNFVWIDRKNNVLKLSQGEYVALSRLEAQYSGAIPLIRQIYLYGTSFRPCLVAVVVPNWPMVHEQLGAAPSDGEVSRLLRGAMADVALSAGLKKFEVPRDMLIETEPFTIENGLLSTLGKPLRAAFLAKYRERLEALYDRIEAKQREEALMLRDPASAMSVEDRIAAALRATLGVEEIDLSANPSFADLGGDSFDAITLAMTLEDAFGVPIPVSAIAGPTGNVQRWARMLQAPDGTANGLTFEKVHGAAATELRAEDLDPDRLLTIAPASPAPATIRPVSEATVLVTGANGYLGKFVTLAWLERLLPDRGKLIALVRGRDDADARARLAAAYGAEGALRKRFDELAEGRLEVIAADLGEPSLGLDREQLDDLARRVDRIVHVGALVNHRMSYQDMFQPNVAGTATLIELALTGSIKAFDFVSSTAVAGLPGAEGADLETDDLRHLVPRLALGDGYAAGYAASKWAGEILLRNASEHHGLPVNIFRSGMILAHRDYPREINASDMFIRLLGSLVNTGIRPGSFYRPSVGDSAEGEFAALPVDHIARAMVDIAGCGDSGFRSYDVVPGGRGLSLDRIVDWVESAGYALETASSHADWFAEFEARLRRSDMGRQSGVLPLLAAFAAPMEGSDSAQRGRRFAAALDAAGGEGAPDMTETYIHKHLDDMRLLGLIPEPARG